MIININEAGRLGNQVFQHAQILAYAEDHSITFLNLAFSNKYKAYFEGSRKDGLYRKSTSRKFISEILPSWFLIKLFNKPFKILCRISPFSKRLFYHKPGIIGLYDLNRILPKPGIKNITVLNGWCFNAIDSFNKQKHFIQNYFTPIPEILQASQRLVDKARVEDALVVGCHIRRGDYKQFRSGQYYFELITYKEIMKSVEALNPSRNTKFLICSDESIDKSEFKDLSCIYSNNSEIVDMYALAHCDFIIGPPSTFSSWASFWGEVPRYEIHDPNKRPKLIDFHTYALK